MSWENVSAGVCNQVRLKPSCSASEASLDVQADLRLCWSNIAQDTFSHAQAHLVGTVKCFDGNFQKVKLVYIIGEHSLPVSAYEPQHDKTNKVTVRPAKSQISLGICPVWSESSLCAQWVAKDPNFLHAGSEDSDQSGRMPRLIWVFAGRTCHFVGLVTMRLIFSSILMAVSEQTDWLCLLNMCHIMRKTCLRGFSTR